MRTIWSSFSRNREAFQTDVVHAAQGLARGGVLPTERDARLSASDVQRNGLITSTLAGSKSFTFRVIT